jgi:hypothetical protein
MERTLLSQVEGLAQMLHHGLQTQSETIAALEAEIRTRNEAITRLTLLLGSWLDPKALDPS